MRSGRLGLSAIDKREIWSRWKAGQTLHEIGRAYGKCHNTIRAVLLPRGGIPPVARRRSRLALTFAEREDISRGMASGSSLRKLPATLRLSLTWDRGLEMAKHKEFTVATDVQVYFCDPQSPWQRGTNENTNLLLRQYFPRGTNLAPITQAQLDQVSLRLNQRPRKTLGFQTPASKLQASVASTA
jgi:IS30 family transposase